MTPAFCAAALFVLAAAWLNRILLKGRRNAGLITGLGPKLDSGHAVTQLQDADEAVILI